MEVEVEGVECRAAWVAPAFPDPLGSASHFFATNHSMPTRLRSSIPRPCVFAQRWCAARLKPL